MMGDVESAMVRRRVHVLKTVDPAFAAVASGSKMHEWRRDDRGYAVGDVLFLRLFDPATGLFRGQNLVRVVSYISRGPAFDIPEGFAVLSLSSELTTGVVTDTACGLLGEMLSGMLDLPPLYRREGTSWCRRDVEFCAVVRSLAASAGHFALQS